MALLCELDPCQKKQEQKQKQQKREQKREQQERHQKLYSCCKGGQEDEEQATTATNESRGDDETDEGPHTYYHNEEDDEERRDTTIGFACCTIRSTINDDQEASAAAASAASAAAAASAAVNDSRHNLDSFIGMEIEFTTTRTHTRTHTGGTFPRKQKLRRNRGLHEEKWDDHYEVLEHHDILCASCCYSPQQQSWNEHHLKAEAGGYGRRSAGEKETASYRSVVLNDLHIDIDIDSILLTRWKPCCNTNNNA